LFRGGHPRQNWALPDRRTLMHRKGWRQPRRVRAAITGKKVETKNVERG